MSFPAGFAESFQKESWALYSVGVLGAVLRFVARIRRFGIRHLQIEDFIMVFGLIWYTVLCVALNQVASGGGSNLMTDEDVAKMTPANHAERVRGSKWVFVSEHAFILAVWSCKSCMLVIYARITEGLSQKRLIHYCAIYVALGFVATELGLFLTCIPLHNYWAVPTPNPQCSNYQRYEIIQACFSITADIFMLAVAIPLLIKIRLPPKQKIILVVLFGMGIFVIVAAILNKIYCLVPSLISYVYMNWYFREATVAILVTNIPLIWSLLRDVFPGLLKSWTGGSNKKTVSDRYLYPSSFPFSSTTNNNTNKSRRRSRAFGVTSEIHSAQPHLDMDELVPSTRKNGDSVGITRADSNRSESLSMSSDDSSARALRIRQDITFSVEAEERQDSTASTVSRPHHGYVSGKPPSF